MRLYLLVAVVCFAPIAWGQAAAPSIRVQWETQLIPIDAENPDTGSNTHLTMVLSGALTYRLDFGVVQGACSREGEDLRQPPPGGLVCLINGEEWDTYAVSIRGQQLRLVRGGTSGHPATLASITVPARARLVMETRQ